VLLFAKVMRDPDTGESRGFGFIAFQDHKTAMKGLEHLNDNPKVFGGSRRPIVEFAIEDKRNLRMQQEEGLRDQQRALDHV